MKKKVAGILSAVLLVTVTGCKVKSEDVKVSVPAPVPVYVPVNVANLDALGPVVNLKGYDSKSVEVENKAREVAFMTYGVLDVFAKANSVSKDKFLETFIASRITGKITIKGIGDFMVRVS